MRFDQAGTYDLWARAAAANFGADSWYLGIAGDGSLSQGMSAKLVGTTLPFAWSNSRLDASKATITVSAPGVYPLSLWMREDGAVIDRILIQPTGSAAPVGDGPIQTAPSGAG